MDIAQPMCCHKEPLVPKEDIWEWENGFDFDPQHMNFLDDAVAGCTDPTPTTQSLRKDFFFFSPL